MHRGVRYESSPGSDLQPWCPIVRLKAGICLFPVCLSSDGDVLTVSLFPECLGFIKRLFSFSTETQEVEKHFVHFPLELVPHFFPIVKIS